MRAKIWGTRGSIPTPGMKTVRYGGNTPCVELRTNSGNIIILDCGTGLRLLGEELIEREKPPIHGAILISHTHWDHIHGIPFFKPFFQRNSEWDIFAPKGAKTNIEAMLEMHMDETFFPVSLKELDATIRFHDLSEGTIHYDGVTIKAQRLNHTPVTFGYRVEADNASVVYALDHEPYSNVLASGKYTKDKENDKHIQFLKNADLVIHDAQYLAKEYEKKKGWGHSTYEYVAEICCVANVKKVAAIHHDPNRDDNAIDLAVAEIRKKLEKEGCKSEFFAAAEGMVIEL